MEIWGNETPIKEYCYRGRDAQGNVLEFMNWRMVFPVGYNKNNPAKYPMIIMLHGSGESGRLWSGNFNYGPNDVRYDNNDRNIINGGKEHEKATGYSTLTGLPSGPVKFPGIVIWPQVSYNGAWEGGWDNGVLSDNNRMASQIIEWLIAHYDVDPDRISIHGLSNGAKGVWDLAAKRPDLIAAVLPMSGVGSNDEAQTDVLVTTPIWAFPGWQRYQSSSAGFPGYDQHVPGQRRQSNLHRISNPCPWHLGDSLCRAQLLSVYVGGKQEEHLCVRW